MVFNDVIKSGFETSPFLLKKEMVQIMGGTLEAEPFQWFQQLVVKGYLAARCVPAAYLVEVWFKASAH